MPREYRCDLWIAIKAIERAAQERPAAEHALMMIVSELKEMREQDEYPDFGDSLEAGIPNHRALKPLS